MLTTLLDLSDAAALPLGPTLVSRHGGALGFPLRADGPYVIANFVSTLDGVVSYAVPGKAQAALVSAGHPADLFVLALLRACADAVVVGAGTLREEGRHLWTPEYAFPEEAATFAALRAGLGKPRHPPTVFVSASGDVDLRAPAFTAGDDTLVITTTAGAKRLGKAPKHVRVRALGGAGRPPAADIVRAVVEETGARLVLTEGGPKLLGQFVGERVLDELFLTIAPQIAGRSPREPRLALVEGVAFAPEEARWWRLRSVKRADDYLFLRFASSRAR